VTFTWEETYYWDANNFSKDVAPLGSLLGRLSNKPSTKCEKWPTNFRPSPDTHLHHLRPPQNELGLHCSGSGPGTHQLINAQNFDFAKPKLFFKNIGKYAATSTYIHVRIPFNFTTVFNTKQAIAGVYDQLLAQHDEPFKSITKSVTDVSLSIIEGSLEEFRDIIKALPQKTEISTPGRPKCFIAIGISIAAMAMSTFNTVRITQLNEEISTLKEKTDLILDVVHLHEKHLHHIEEKLEQTNKLLADLLDANVWFTPKVTDAIEKKFESVIWHHENVVK